MFLVKILVSSSYKKDLKLTTMIRIFEKVNKIYFEFAFKFYISLWSLSTFCSFVLFCDLWNTLFKFFFILFFKKFFFSNGKMLQLVYKCSPISLGYICVYLSVTNVFQVMFRICSLRILCIKEFFYLLICKQIQLC